MFRIWILFNRNPFKIAAVLLKNTRLLISHDVCLCVFPLFSSSPFLTMIQAGRSVFFQMERCCSHFICIEMLFSRFNSLLVSLLLLSLHFTRLPFDFLFPFMHVIWKVCLCNGFVISKELFYIAMQCLFMECC